MENKIFSLFFLLFVILSSCKGKNKNIIFNNKKAHSIIDYLNTDLKVKSNKNQLFIIFTTNSCHACTVLVSNYLYENKNKSNKIAIISLGNTRKETIHLVEGLKDNYQIYYDFTGIGFEKLDLFSNAVVEVTDNKVVNFFLFDGQEEIKLTLDIINHNHPKVTIW